MTARPTQPASFNPPPTEQDIRTLLTGIIDPETGINILDMGLIYEILIAPGQIHIYMTTTSPACPVGAMLTDEIRATLVRKYSATLCINIELTYDPPWEPSMMSDAARRQFGW